MTNPIRVLLLAIVAILSVPIGAMAQVKWSEAPFDAALAQGAAEKGFVMVDFFTTWCVPCKMLDTTVWSDPAVAKFLEEHRVVALRLDAEKEGTDLAKRYSLRGYPTVILLNPKGEELTRFVGARDKQVVLNQFAAAFKDPRTVDDLKRAVKAHPADLQQGYELALKLKQGAGGPGSGDEAREILASLVERDRDNAKGVGAKALMELLAWTLPATLRPDILGARATWGPLSAPKGPYPNLFQGKEDPDLLRLRANVAQAYEAYLLRLEGDCADQLMKAVDLLGAMKDVQPVLSWEGMAMIEASVGSGENQQDRRLGEAFHLFAAKACKDPEEQNNCAWYFYTAQTHLDLAEKLVRQCLAAGPNPNAEDTLAHILFTTGHGEEAFKIERKLIADAKAKGDSASAQTYQTALESWEKGVADQTLPSPSKGS